MVLSLVWLAAALAFALSLLGGLWQASPMLGLARGLVFLLLALALSALGAAWVAWFAHGRPTRHSAAGDGAHRGRVEVTTRR